MKTMRLFALTAFLLACMLGGCEEDTTTNPRSGTIDPEPTNLSIRVERTNDFAFSLYEHLVAEGGGNILVSPHSIAVCFGMAYAGARGLTQRDIAEVLHFQYPPTNFHAAMKELNDLLMSRGQSAAGESVNYPSFSLKIANGCWGADYHTYLTAYCDTLDQCYGAPMQLLDFAFDPLGSRDAINLWVSDRTSGLIPELLPEDAIDANTYMVLANTIYFYASWKDQFDPNYTWDSYFHMLDGSIINVPIMYGEGFFRYYECDDYCAVSLPYEGEEVSMIGNHADEGRFETVEAMLDTEFFAAVVDSLRSEHITIHLPRFTCSSDYSLKKTLMDMGMPGAFAPGADFTGMDGVDDGVPWIGWVEHKTFISVDEYGTLAVAATGMGLSLGIHNSFDANRPFIYAILDHGTGTILFLGRVLDPRG